MATSSSPSGWADKFPHYTPEGREGKSIPGSMSLRAKVEVSRVKRRLDQDLAKQRHANVSKSWMLGLGREVSLIFNPNCVSNALIRYTIEPHTAALQDKE